MSMDRDKALSKIRKCLALAKSANPGEAANAMRQAQALMRQHGLEQVDVDLAAVSEARQKATSPKPQVWEMALASLVADTLGCELFIGTGFNLEKLRELTFKNEAHFVYVGVAGNAEMAVYAFKVLQRQCKDQRADYIRRQPGRCKQATKSARGDAFALGWVSAVQGQLERFAAPEQHSSLLAEYMAAKHPKLKPAAEPRRRDKRGSISDIALGRAAGRQARLERGIGAASGVALIEGGAP